MEELLRGVEIRLSTAASLQPVANNQPGDHPFIKLHKIDETKVHFMLFLWSTFFRCVYKYDERYQTRTNW